MRSPLFPLFFAFAACSAHNRFEESEGGSAGDDGGLVGDLDGSSSGCTTTVSGIVFDPAGKNPLYGIAVYVPGAPLKPLATGASCYACEDLYSGEPVSTAITDASGKFTLGKAPSGPNVPIVVQIGKWRRRTWIPDVKACQDNPQPAGSLRLPRNHNEGDMPSIAISTGGADSLECLLSRVGIDASEFVGGPGGSGRVHVFKGGDDGSTPAANTPSPGPASAQALWPSKAALMPYDVVLLGCEGHETDSVNRQALYDYAEAGGRVFASHFHYTWFNAGPFGAANLASWKTGSNAIGDIKSDIVKTLPNNKPFPKGIALEQWLGNVGALVGGELPITTAKHNANIAAAHTNSQAWILAAPSSPAPGAAQYFSFDTPFAAPPTGKCGRGVYSDMHVGAASGDYPGPRIVPNGCAQKALSPQEAALEFMLFDLSSCLKPDDQPPKPPAPK